MQRISQEIIIETQPCSANPDRTLRLVEITEGRAGGHSGNRWQERRWSVRFDEGGKTHGRQFRTLEDARTYFNNQTSSADNAEVITLAALDEAFDDASN